MHPAHIFDVVHARVRELQARSGAVSATGIETARSRAPLATADDFVYDFYLVGRQTLRDRWPRKFQMFAIYFIGGMAYREAIKALHIPAGTFDRWSVEIRIAVGRQLRPAGLYPPRLYALRSTHRAGDHLPE